MKISFALLGLLIASVTSVSLAFGGGGGGSRNHDCEFQGIIAADQVFTNETNQLKFTAALKGRDCNVSNLNWQATSVRNGYRELVYKNFWPERTDIPEENMVYFDVTLDRWDINLAPWEDNSQWYEVKATYNSTTSYMVKVIVSRKNLLVLSQNTL